MNRKSTDWDIEQNKPGAQGIISMFRKKTSFTGEINLEKKKGKTEGQNRRGLSIFRDRDKKFGMLGHSHQYQD